MQVPALTDVQDKVYGEPTVLLAERVSGEEEIPEGVVAVLTPDAPDVLSHSSVRARNMKVRVFVLVHGSGCGRGTLADVHTYTTDASLRLESALAHRDTNPK